MPAVPALDSLLGVKGYTRKYKAGGVEVRNKPGAGVTIHFRKEKVYALTTASKAEKLDTMEKEVPALMCALAVFALLTVDVKDAVDSRFPTVPLLHNNRGVVGPKIYYVDCQVHVELQTELLKYVEKVNTEKMAETVNRRLKKVRNVIYFTIC